MKKSVLLSTLLLATASGLFAETAATPAAPATTPATSAATAAAELTQASTSILASAKSLLANPQLTDAMKAQLTKLTDSVLGNKDGAATEALNKIVALKPGADQAALVKELQTNLGVLVLGRNFDPKDPASSGAVKQTIDAIKAKDTAAALTGLQKLGTQAKLTDAQKQIVTNLVSSYGGKLAGVTDKVNKAASALKGFGL